MAARSSTDPAPRAPVPASPATRWDIFCNVVDHFGDIGVSWRLARQLREEHGMAVTLYVDDLESFRRLCPAVDADAPTQSVEDITVHRWVEAMRFERPADVVIDAFGSRAPPAYLEAMSKRPTRPVWINLEYLSAEDWVEDCHRVPSPHPRLPLTRFFFFPGFTAGTGGLLEERHLAQQRLSFLGSAEARTAAWARWECEPPSGERTQISLFGYGGPSVPTLLRAWADGSEPIRLLVPEGRVLDDVARFAGQSALRAGDRASFGALDIAVLPFRTQADYDQLLWLCDCNFVRGEDSFVRAQWAEHPFVWNIYPQTGGAHWAKLHAFIHRYGEGMDADAMVAVREFWRLWNRGETSSATLGQAWRRFWLLREDLQAHNAGWAAKLRTLGNLTANLVRFAVERL